jgi:hypothetical protein
MRKANTSNGGRAPKIVFNGDPGKRDVRTNFNLPTYFKVPCIPTSEYPYNSHQYQYQCLCVGGSWYFALAAQKNGAGSALQLRERERHGGSWCHSWLAVRGLCGVLL